MEVQLKASLISARHRGECSVSRSDHFTLGKRAPPPYPLNSGWVSPRPGVYVLMRRETFLSLLERLSFTAHKGTFTIGSSTCILNSVSITNSCCKVTRPIITTRFRNAMKSDRKIQCTIFLQLALCKWCMFRV